MQWVRSSVYNIKARVNHKEGKRVSNALYTPYKKFLENYTPGIQKLTNESTRYIVGGSRVQANVSRSQYKTSVHEESSIKYMKTPLFFTVLRKVKCIAPWLVTCTQRQITLLAKNILHGVYGAFDSLFPSLFTIDKSECHACAYRYIAVV